MVLALFAIGTVSIFETAESERNLGFVPSGQLFGETT